MATNEERRKVLQMVEEGKLTPEDGALLGHLHLVAQKLTKDLNLADGYRLVLNCDRAGGQTVPHLHLHLLGGRAMGWPPG